MVFQKRLDAGFIGCQIPTMPRFPRSARGKRSPQKKAENTPMHPFDMLATVAGELLAKRESSCSLYKTAEITTAGNMIKKEQLDHGSPSKSDVFDQGSCDESSFVARLVSHAENVAASDFAVVKSDGVSKMDGFAWDSAQSGLKSHSQKLTKTGTLKNDAMEIQKLEDPIDLDTKTPALLSSDSSVEIPPFGDYHSAHSSSSLHSLSDGMDLILDRDDDENSYWRTHNSAIYSKLIKPHCKGERRVRKMTTTNDWKDDGEAMNDGELWNGDEEIKPAFRARNLCYTRRRTQRSSFKRKKSIERISFSAPDGGFCSQGVHEALVKDDTKLNSNNSNAELNDAHGRSCSTTEQSLSYESADHSVKLSIKSFKVPELFIEIPSNATVGTLKRTVMEAVTAVLSGGLRVGVLLEGKKIRDDNKTLLQAGISNKDELDNLGFALEPTPTRSPPPPCNSHSCEPQPFNKIPPRAAPAPAPDKVTCAPSTQTPPNITENCTESDHDSVHSPTNPSSSVDQMCDNSKALVPILATNSEALPVVPFRNSKLSEMVVRRIRRPFSVSEVEALVQAVEKLGTGRWRDVKLRAFDNVKHRTYVDLKDKWKTLVHTARISPQQRRGEPVPQDLLDRVLSAHAYWGQQQAKSTRLAEPCLVLT